MSKQKAKEILENLTNLTKGPNKLSRVPIAEMVAQLTVEVDAISVSECPLCDGDGGCRECGGSGRCHSCDGSGEET